MAINQFQSTTFQQGLGVNHSQETCEPGLIIILHLQTNDITTTIWKNMKKWGGHTGCVTEDPFLLGDWVFKSS